MVFSFVLFSFLLFEKKKMPRKKIRNRKEKMGGQKQEPKVKGQSKSLKESSLLSLQKFETEGQKWEVEAGA
jgi:hypothetical protein